MIFYLTLIFCCQLAGELVTQFFALPIPGPVAGMAILFTGLMIKGGLPEDLGKVADAIIGNLSLLFVPAGVGVMLHLGLIATDALPISAALIISTVLTVAVTGLLMSWLGPKPDAADLKTGAKS
ncbi:MAG: CidA/LrgA family protein [Rhodospirillaceae bacterium]